MWGDMVIDCVRTVITEKETGLVVRNSDPVLIWNSKEITIIALEVPKPQ